MQQCQQVLTLLLQALFICSLPPAYVWGATAVTAATQQPQQAAAAQATTAAEAAAAAPSGPPTFCKPADAAAGLAYQNAAGPTNMVWGGNMLKVYHNLFFHNK
jgi:hypothetical protein